MANIDLTRTGELAQKKGVCVFSGLLVEGTGNGELGILTDNYHLGKLPPDAIITNAYIHIVTASDAATSNTGKLGTAEAGSQILSAANLKTLGKQGTFTGQSKTATGVDVFLTTTIVGAATAVGEYVVTVEYLEYTKNTGEYTKFS